MSIQDEFDRDKDVDNYTRGKDIAIRRFEDIFTVLNFAVTFKNKYSSDATEVNAGITWIKDKCQQIIDSY